MKATYKTASGRLMFEVTGETVKDVFERVADLSEVFEAETSCGVCNSPHIRMVHRVATKGAKKYDYYELHCGAVGCRARFAFGQNMEGGGLFPKRKDENGYLANRGWFKYVREAGEEDYSQERH